MVRKGKLFRLAANLSLKRQTITQAIRQAFSRRSSSMAEAAAANAVFYAKVNALTNWERNQWAKAGYPGLRGKDIDRVPAGAGYSYHPNQVV